MRQLLPLLTGLDGKTAGTAAGYAALGFCRFNQFYAFTDRDMEKLRRIYLRLPRNTALIGIDAAEKKHYEALRARYAAAVIRNR